jgi:hypothetical protein
MKYNKKLDELLISMYHGKRVTHEDWLYYEYITIGNGEFVDEEGELFVISPWMIHDMRFGIMEEQ